jgi:imidazolonepropionase-like amidohydrolase
VTTTETTIPAASGLAVPAATGTRRVWLRVGTLLDGTSTQPRHDVHIVYDARGICFVGDGGSTPSPAALRSSRVAPDLDAPDATLLPGLIEAHAHLFLAGGEMDLDERAIALTRPRADLLEGAVPRLEKLVRLGIAGVRDAGDKDGIGLTLSRLCQSHGRPLMPYVDSPGAAIHRRGRYGSFLSEPLDDFPTPDACVAARVAAGADRIKLIPSGIINFKKGAVTSPPQMTPGEVAAIVAAARARGRQTFAHASGDTGIDHAIDGGVDSIEHGFFVRGDQLARMRDRGIAWVPTFAPVQLQLDHAARFGWDAEVRDHLRRILDAHAASLTAAHALGVPIVAGSDAGSCGVAHGVGLLYELQLMERAGMPAIAVVNAATGVGAGRLGYREPIGRIEAGCRSRFILTRHSPLDTVANLRRPRTVIFDGAVLASEVDPAGL